MSVEEPIVQIVRLDPELPLTRYAHPGDAGADLCTAIDAVLAPGERRLLPTGVALAVPEGWACLLYTSRCV